MIQYRLDDQQFEHYRTEGYVVVERLFTSDDLRGSMPRFAR